MPIQLGRLKDLFISTMESEGRSTRYVQVLKSYCGTFVREIGPDTMTDQITREMIQEFLNDRKVGPRGKLNFERSFVSCRFSANGSGVCQRIGRKSTT